ARTQAKEIVVKRASWSHQSAMQFGKMAVEGYSGFVSSALVWLPRSECAKGEYRPVREETNRHELGPAVRALALGAPHHGTAPIARRPKSGPASAPVSVGGRCPLRRSYELPDPRNHVSSGVGSPHHPRRQPKKLACAWGAVSSRRARQSSASL